AVALAPLSPDHRVAQDRGLLAAPPAPAHGAPPAPGESHREIPPRRKNHVGRCPARSWKAPSVWSVLLGRSLIVLRTASPSLDKLLTRRFFSDVQNPPENQGISSGAGAEVPPKVPPPGNWRTRRSAGHSSGSPPLRSTMRSGHASMSLQ